MKKKNKGRKREEWWASHLRRRESRTQSQASSHLGGRLTEAPPAVPEAPAVVPEAAPEAAPEAPAEECEEEQWSGEEVFGSSDEEVREEACINVSGWWLCYVCIWCT